MRLREIFQVARELISQLQDTFCLQIAAIRSKFFDNLELTIYDIHPSCILILVTLVFSAVVVTNFKPKKSKRHTALHPLSLLLQILTPACSLWPQAYIRLSKSHRLQIPLKTLIEDIISGRVELRAPYEDLKRLVAGDGKLEVQGCQLVLSVGISLRLKVLWWWMKSVLGRNTRARSTAISSEVNVDFAGLDSHSQASAPLLVTTHQNHYTGLTSHPSGASTVLPAILPTLPVHVLEKLAVAIALDFISPAYLENTLLAVPEGSLALLEFTNRDSRVSPGSSAWIFSVLPLACAASASKTVALPGFLGLLEGVCTVLSVQNVSAQYARLLEDYAHGLNNGAIRRMFLEQRGGPNKDEAVRAWRAEKLWAHWGAACYASGGLARWIVCVRRLPSRSREA